MADQQLIPIEQLDKVGVVRDTPAHAVLPNGFTDCRNVILDNNSVVKRKGTRRIFSGLQFNNVDIDINFVAYWPHPTRPRFIVSDGPRLYSVIRDADGNTRVLDANPSGVTYPTDSQWRSTLFNGGYSIILNNGQGTPVYLTADNTQNEETVQELPNWNYDSVNFTITAGVIKSYNNVLIAGDITLNHTSSSPTPNVIERFPSTIRISTQAAPGNVPTTWRPDIGAATADEFELSSTGRVVDVVPLKNTGVIYTTNSIHLLTFGTDNRPFVQTTSATYGALKENVVTEFDGRHFVVGSDDIFIHAGSGDQIQSVSDLRVRDYFYENLHPTNSDRTFAVRDRENDEIHLFFPNLSSMDGSCNEILSYNYRANAWTINNTNALAGTVGSIPGGGISTGTITFSGLPPAGPTTAVAEVQEIRVANTASYVNFQQGLNTNPELQLTAPDGQVFTFLFGVSTASSVFTGTNLNPSDIGSVLRDDIATLGITGWTVSGVGDSIDFTDTEGRGPVTNLWTLTVSSPGTPFVSDPAFTSSERTAGTLASVQPMLELRIGLDFSSRDVAIPYGSTAAQVASQLINLINTDPRGRYTAVAGQTGTQVVYTVNDRSPASANIELTISGTRGTLSAAFGTTNISTDPERPWAAGEFNDNRSFIVSVNGSNNILAHNLGYQDDGSNYVSYVEKTHFGFGPTVDKRTRVKHIYPQMDGGPVRLQMSTVDNPAQTIPRRWKHNKVYNPAKEYKRDPRIEGRYVNLRIDDSNQTTAEQWRLTSYFYDIAKGGDQ